MNPTTLVIDIGGTNTRIACAHEGHVDTSTVRRYRNAEVGTFAAAVSDYLGQTGVSPEAACVAGAGPVRDAVLTLTNLDWTIDRETLMNATGASTVSILNDLQAQGHAVSALPDTALTELVPGAAASDQAAKLVVNVGTGMNVAPVYRLRGLTLVPPSEAGHVLFATQTPQEADLAAFVRQRHGIASVEEVLSGRGLETIYEFISGARKLAADIMGALDTDAAASETLDLFCTIMGRVAGDLTLVHLPFGGVYLVGGVVQHTAPYLTRFGFVDAFTEKGRFSEFMSQFPVRVVNDDYAALIGCASHMAEQMSLLQTP